MARLPVGSEYQRPVVVTRNDVHLTPRGTKSLNVTRLSWNKKAAVARSNGSESTLAVSFHQNTVPCAHAADFGLHTVEVSRDHQVELSIPVHIARKNAVHGRELRLER